MTELIGRLLQAILCGSAAVGLIFCIVDGIRKGDFRA